MRVVANAALRHVGEGAPAGLLPSRERLESVRHLSQRFPALREVTLVRVSPRVAPAAARLADRVWLALESMQETGSFKVRGALVATEALVNAGRREIVAVSAGNHGIGVARAAKELGANATIVVPSGAPRAKLDKIAAYGATLVRSASPGYDDAEREALELARTRRATFLSPYDDLDVIVGNGGSLAFEITRALGKIPDTVVAPIGGGGLTTGLACAFAERDDTRDVPKVWGIQSEASCAFAKSLERGAAVTTLPHAETLAEGLEGGLPERAFARVRATLAGCIVATEEELARAMTFAFRELGLALEGSAAIALTPLLADEAVLPRASDAVIVLTGRNVDPERLARLVC